MIWSPSTTESIPSLGEAGTSVNPTTAVKDAEPSMPEAPTTNGVGSVAEVSCSEATLSLTRSPSTRWIVTRLVGP